MSSFDYFLDEVRFYQNATQLGSTVYAALRNLGPMDEINIGYVPNKPYTHSIGSVEFYLKAMNSSQIAALMTSSSSYFVDKDMLATFN